MPIWRTVLTVPVAMPASGTDTNRRAASDVSADNPPRPRPATTDPATKCVHPVAAVTPVIIHIPTAMSATPAGMATTAGTRRAPNIAAGAPTTIATVSGSARRPASKGL